jgi:hypothetical protein
MEDIEADDAAGSGSDSGRPIREASCTTNEKDEHLIYDWMRFKRDKIWCRYNLYYNGRKAIMVY